MSETIIRPIQDSDDLEALTLLIRDAYKVLLDKGFRYWGTFQSVQDTKKRLSSGHAFVVEFQDEIIATITLKEQDTGPEPTPWYDRHDVCFFTQFAVKPSYQKSGLGSRLMTFIENYARELGYKEIALDTCEDASGLIEYYQKRNYRHVDYVQWDTNVVNYRSVVLSKKLKGNEE